MDADGSSETANDLGQWAFFDDARRPGWRVQADISFLTSSWSCIWGDGCAGIHRNGHGCCDVGFTFDVGYEGDRLRAAVARLTPDDWERHHPEPKWYNRPRWATGDEQKMRNSKVVDGACIFYNTGATPGCAFHQHALRVGENPVLHKPQVCWMVPLRLEENREQQVRVLRPGRNVDWDRDGVEATLPWWCIDSDAHAYEREVPPVYETMQFELRLILGDEVYAALKEHCDLQPHGRMPHWVPVNSPTLRNPSVTDGTTRPTASTT